MSKSREEEWYLDQDKDANWTNAHQSNIKEEPVKTNVSRKIFDEAYNIRVKKNKDYNNGPVTIDMYYPFGHKSYVHMLNTKMLRLISLVGSGHKPENESLRDTLLDMINYCTIYAERIDKGDLND